MDTDIQFGKMVKIDDNGYYKLVFNTIQQYT